MTIAVDLGRKATKQTNKNKNAMLELIAHAQLPLINAHASVAKARISFSPNKMDPDQTRQNTRFLLDFNRWYIVYLKTFFQKVKFKRKKEKKMRKHTHAIKINCMGSIRRVDLLIFVYRFIHYKQMDLYAISEDPN